MANVRKHHVLRRPWVIAMSAIALLLAVAALDQAGPSGAQAEVKQVNLGLRVSAESAARSEPVYK